jgi:hypothetical protein
MLNAAETKRLQGIHNRTLFKSMEGFQPGELITKFLSLRSISSIYFFHSTKSNATRLALLFQLKLTLF